MIKKKIAGFLLTSSIVFALPSCVNDDAVVNDDSNCPQNTLNLSIAVPEPAFVDPSSTRAAMANQGFEEVNNINIIVYKDTWDPQVDVFYFDKNNPTYGSKFPLKASSENLKISVLLKKAPAGGCHIIANYNGKINIDSLYQVTKDKGLDPDIDGREYFPYSASYFTDEFALGLPSSGKPQNLFYASVFSLSDKDGNCSTTTLSLVRQYAKVTLALNNTGLKSGVEITPRKIGVHNVAASTNFASAYLHSEIGLERNQIGRKGVTANVNGYTVAVTAPTAVTATTPALPTVNTDLITYHKALPDALFLFENTQGGNSNTNELNKTLTVRPLGSYISVEADYQYTDGGGPTVSGTVIYKFMLGLNATNDYAVRRNNHYAVTLNLKDWGGLTEAKQINGGGTIIIGGPQTGASWRVEVKEMK